MKELRRKLNRFIYNNSNKGIPNLMLYISVLTLVSYFIMMADRSGAFARAICFDRTAILHGQVWRLFTFILVPQSNGIWLFLLLFAYYGIGRMVEQAWGTLKFNLFYLCGVLLTDIAAMIFGGGASAYYLNLSLFLALATLFPDNQVLLFYIIPLKMKYLAWAYLLVVLVEIVQGHFFSLFALLNYFLFFGWDFVNVLPGNGQFVRDIRRKHARPNPNWADRYQTTKSSKRKQSAQRTVKTSDAPAYRHKCAVCGRTDISNPELEFRYCSKCRGYYCYCEEHINNHAHIK